jgi:hypothetical protein
LGGKGEMKIVEFMKNWFLDKESISDMERITHSIKEISERIQLIKDLCQQALDRKYYYCHPDHGDNYTIGVNEGIKMVLKALNGDTSGLEDLIENQVDYDVKEERKLERVLVEVVNE